ncbi:MAG: hypothetical protein ABGZ53_02850, partial [Fuerstiella sp.]
VVEEGVSIHTDTSGSGLTVKATETVHSTQIAQSGSDSDKGAVAASAVYAGHESTTVSQVDAGVTIDGGALNITSSSDVITEAVTGGFSWGPIGIGMSGGVIDVKRRTGAFLGRRTWSDGQDDDLMYGGHADGTTTASPGGSVDVRSLAVTAANDGVTGNFSIVGAGAIGRESPNPIDLDEFPDVDLVDNVGENRNNLQNDAANSIDDSLLPRRPQGLEGDALLGAGDDSKSAFAFAGDAAVNLVSDIADAQVDVAGFMQVDVGFDGVGDLAITATDDTLHWAFSGAGAYAGASSGTAVAFTGSFAVNRLDIHTEAHLTDSSQSSGAPQKVGVAGDVTVQATADASDAAENAFGVWAISASLGVSAADGKHWSTAAALNMSINLVNQETTRATIGNVNLGSNDAGWDTGEVLVAAQNHRSMNADGGAFDLSLHKSQREVGENQQGAGSSVAVGGSNSINKIEDLTVEALVDNNTMVTSDSLTVNACANPTIRSVTVSGSIEGSSGSQTVSLNGSESGSVNEIQRKILAHIGDASSEGTITVDGSVNVSATDEAEILAISGGIAFSVLRKGLINANPEKSGGTTFAGQVGFAWSHNWLRGESQVRAEIVGFTVHTESQAADASVVVEATAAASIATYVVQLGVLYSGQGTAEANITGAISKNQIDGSDDADADNVVARIEDSIVNGSVDVTAKDSANIHAAVWSAELSLAADVVNTSVGISYGENEYGSTLAAEIVNSTVTAATGDVSVRALSTPDLFTEVGNANVGIQWQDKDRKLEENPLSISLDYTGTFATNTVHNTVAARIDSSSLAVTAGTLTLLADDKATADSRAYGNQFVLSLALTGENKKLSVDVAALTQFATNEVATDLSALLTDSPADPTAGSMIDVFGALSVTASKEQTIQAYMETTSVGVGVSTKGMAINLSAATSVVHNSVDTVGEHQPRTYAAIDNTFLEAAAVVVSAEAKPSLYTKIWDVDVQVAVGETAAVAALYGESKAVNTLKEDVQATIAEGSNVTASSGSIEVLANLLPTDLPDPDPNYSRYRPPPQTNIYADTHSVGVAVASAISKNPIAFAGAVILSDTVSTSQSNVIAKVENSDLQAAGGIS